MGGFFAAKQPWSRHKHEILKRILQTKVWQHRNNITYIDGLAGAGSYADGSEGSPLVALNVFSEIYRELAQKKGLSMHIDSVFVEQDPENYAQLAKILEDVKGIRVHHKQGSFYDCIDQALDIAGGAQGVVFIDPFGVKDFSQEAVDKIRDFGRNIDVVINFPIATMRRMVGQGRVYEGTRQTLEDKFQTPYQEDTGVFFEDYISRLRSHYSGVGWIPLKMKVTKGAELFYMTLCTNDINVYTSFNDFAAPESQDVGGRVLDCLSGEPLSLKNLFFRLINSEFGYAKIKDYNKSIRQHLKHQEIKRRNSYHAQHYHFSTKGINIKPATNIYLSK